MIISMFVKEWEDYNEDWLAGSARCSDSRCPGRINLRLEFL